jgi:hypothetical protein
MNALDTHEGVSSSLASNRIGTLGKRSRLRDAESGMSTFTSDIHFLPKDERPGSTQKILAIWLAHFMLSELTRLLCRQIFEI